MKAKSAFRAFSPSLAGTCLRYAVMDLLRFGRALDPESLAAMQEGSRRHRQFQQELMHLGGLVAVEERVKDDSLMVSGRMDAVVRWRETMQVVEYKTVNAERFEQIRRDGPLIAHFAQLALYMELTGYPSGHLVVESRGNAERIDFVFAPDAAWGIWLRQRIVSALSAAKSRQLPEREVSLGCRSCDRWSRCFKTEDDRDQAAKAHPLWEPEPPYPQLPAVVD